MFLASNLEDLLPCCLAVKFAPRYPENSRDWKNVFERLFRYNGVRPSTQLRTWFLHLCLLAKVESAACTRPWARACPASCKTMAGWFSGQGYTSGCSLWSRVYMAQSVLCG